MIEGQPKEKTRLKWKDFFNVHSLSNFIVGAILTTLFMLLPYSIQDWKFSGFIDGTFLAGCVGIGFGLLNLASLQGTFDIVSLGFNDLYETIKRNGTRKYKSLFDYREAKKVRRKSKRFAWLAFELVGIIYLIISLSCYFYYY